jgi:PAS domain-containing protein
MNDHDDHGGLMGDLADEYREILDTSSQGIYLFLDDGHKICNARFASLLGYESPEEWAGVQRSFPDAFVAEESQHSLIGAYQAAMEDATASTIQVTWKRRSGGTVDSSVILVPISYDGHDLALHFVDERPA